MTDKFFTFLVGVLQTAGINTVYDAYKTNILKATPRAEISYENETLVQDVDLVSVSRTQMTETLNRKRYDRTVPCRVEITGKTNEEADALCVAFLAALPSRAVIENMRVKVTAEAVERKTLSNTGQLIGVKDAKKIVRVKITHPIIASSMRALITDVKIIPDWRG